MKARRRGTPRRARRALPVAAVALLALLPGPARAYRPFDSTDAAVADRGEIELELGPIGYLAQPPTRALVAPSVVLNWGFAEGWEAVLQGEYLIQLGAPLEEARFRLEENELSLKRVLRDGSLQERGGPSVATELGVLLPTVNGPRGVGAEWFVIVSQRWPDLTIHLNGAARWTRAHEPGAFLGAIFEGHDAWALRPVAEAFVEAGRGAPTTVSGLVGAIGRVRESLSLDAGVRRARGGGRDTTELRLGLTWGFRAGFPR